MQNYAGKQQKQLKSLKIKEEIKVSKTKANCNLDVLNSFHTHLSISAKTLHSLAQTWSNTRKKTYMHLCNVLSIKCNHLISSRLIGLHTLCL